MTIRRKLQLGFLASCTCLVAVCWVSIRGLVVAGDTLRDIEHTTLREVMDTNQAAAATIKLDGDIDRFIASVHAQHPDEIEKSRASITENLASISTALKDLHAEADMMMARATTDEERNEEHEHVEHLKGLEAGLAERELNWAAVAAAAKDSSRLNDADIRRSDQHGQALIEQAMDVQRDAAAEIEEVIEATGISVRRERIVVFAVCALAIAVTGGVSLFTNRPLIRRLKEARVKAEQMGAGDLSARVAVQGNDEMTALARTLNSTAEHLSKSRDELVSAAETAGASSRAKTAFLANMSHEIRTPMTAIMGYSEMLLEPEQSQSDRQDALQVIRRSARHLLELINDILDISKIEADKMVVERLPMDLPQIVADVVSLMRPRAIMQGLGFQLTFGEVLPRVIQSDALRLKQVLMNVLGNALKFTQRGEVRLRVTCEPTATSSTIAFEISDTGIGMTEEQMSRLFMPFTQADESMTRRFGGTGLGLTISKRLTEHLGGGLTAKSLIGVGSSFRIEIDGGPLDSSVMVKGMTESMLAIPMERETPKRIALRGRILLAEDGLDNQRLISLQLRKAGAEVTIAENGREAIDLVKQSVEQARPFDLVLMDMQMPELDGYAATSQLRSMGFTALPIVALTAHAMAEDRGKCMSAGCTDYLTKPLGKFTLLTAAARYLAGSTVTEAGEQSESAAGPAAGQAAAQATAQAAGSITQAIASPSPVLRSTMSDDPDMTEVIRDFVDRLPERAATLVNLLERGNLAELQRTVHQLKGAGGGYGFESITRFAADADRALKQDDPIELIQKKVDDLLSVVRSVEGYKSEKELAHV